MLWAGLGGSVDALAAVQHDVAAALAPLGFAPDARPSPRTSPSPELREARGDPALAAACAGALTGQDFGATRVEAVRVLYRSELSPKGPVYTPLASLPLLGGASRITGGVRRA